MFKNVRINSLYSKNILNYCKISTQESIQKLIKNKYINIKKKVNIQDENKSNNNVIITIYMVISTSCLLFYLNKIIT
jgi:hypothetical protein